MDTLKTILRRLSRIFAHTYAHHRDLFLICESETQLGARLSALSRHFNILPPYMIIWNKSKGMNNDESDNTNDFSDDSHEFRRQPVSRSSTRQLVDVGPISNESSSSDEDDGENYSDSSDE